ncbi:MAG: hypothetical protein AAGH15_28185 [Myxococcota bacterium]
MVRAFQALLLIASLGCASDEVPADAGAGDAFAQGQGRPDTGVPETDAGRDEGLPDLGPPDAGEAGAELILGLGPLEFREVPEGAPVELATGGNAGYHIDVLGRFEGLEPDDLRLVYRGFDADTDEELTSLDRVVNRRRVQIAEDHFVRFERVFLEFDCAADLTGRRFRLEALYVEAGTGRMARDTLTLTIVDEDVTNAGTCEGDAAP